MTAGATAVGSAKNKAFGFSKGFLLTDTEKSRRKKEAAKSNVVGVLSNVPPTAVQALDRSVRNVAAASKTRPSEFKKGTHASSSLLDLEYVSQRSVLLLDEPMDHNASDAPTVNGPLHDRNLDSIGLDKGLGLRALSSTPLISVVEEETNDSSAHQTNDSSVSPFDDTLLPPLNSASLLMLSKQLHRVLLRRQGYQEFIQTHLLHSESRLHVWNIVLPRIAKDGPHFGAAMLQQDKECVSTFCHIMVQETPAADKQTLLGGSLLLSYIIRTQKDKTRSYFQPLQTMVLPKLVQLVQDSVEKRTVLANESLVAAYGLLSLDDTSVTSPFFHTLLTVHETWLSGKKKDSWKRRCVLIVIQDWKRASTRFGDSFSLEGVCDDFGGIRQTLFDPQPMNRDTVILLLKHEDTSCLHPVLRGMLAVFGHDKKLWSPDSIQSVLAVLVPAVLKHDDNDFITAFLVILLHSTDDLDHVIAIILTGLPSSVDAAQKIGNAWRDSLLQDELVPNNRFAIVIHSISKSMFKTPDAMAPLIFFGSLVDINMENEKNLDRILEGVLTVISDCTTEMERTTQDTYQRLAPLLLIRRIPAKVYKALWETFLQDRHDIRVLLERFVNRLAALLISDDATPSERKVAAEIAARCVPFSLDTPYSAFTIIVLPPFRALLSGDTGAFRPVKAALYVACCHAPLASEIEPMQAVASFCLWLVNQESENLLECKQGCMEFFAASLQSTLMEPNSVDPVRRRLENILIGKPNEQAMHLNKGKNMLGLGMLDLTSPMVVLSVWNAFLLVSQRLEQGPGGLDQWAHQMGPWLLDFLYIYRGSAAALQVLFVLVTRSKCCVTGDLERTIDVSHDALKSQDPATRLAALKLIMAIISLDIDRFQRLGRSGATLITIAAVAHKFGDPDFRELAKHILQ